MKSMIAIAWLSFLFGVVVVVGAELYVINHPAIIGLAPAPAIHVDEFPDGRYPYVTVEPECPKGWQVRYRRSALLNSPPQGDWAKVMEWEINLSLYAFCQRM